MLRKKYDVLRKNGGSPLRDFLDAPFEFPRVDDDNNEPRPRQNTLPPEIVGVGDEDTLRSQNVTLNAELDEAKSKLVSLKRQVVQIQNQGRTARRKGERYDAIRKKLKAADEQVRYWKREAERGRVEETSAAALKEANSKNAQLEKWNERLEQQIEDFRERLTEALTDKVTLP